MGSLSPFGGRENESVDPFINAVRLAQQADKRARRTRDVKDLVSASGHWIYIAQTHRELYGSEGEVKHPTGFTGGTHA